jgi:hypothetical protein
MTNQWYVAYAFTSTNGASNDLSFLFNTPGVAETFRNNNATGWQLVGAQPFGAPFDVLWSGGVNLDGSLDPGSAPPDFIYTETGGYNAPIQLQICYTPEPTRQCTGCPPPPPPTGSRSCPASATSGKSVELATGRFIFDLPLLSIAGLGAGQWSFDLGYYANFGIDGIVGKNFNYTQFDHLNELAAIADLAGSVELVSSSNTREIFAWDPANSVYVPTDNNTACTLVRSGSGPTDQFTLRSSNRTVSIFYGFDSSIATPGQLKSITDRYGNTLTLAWASAGGVPQLKSVTDGYGRTIRL